MTRQTQFRKKQLEGNSCPDQCVDGNRNRRRKWNSDHHRSWRPRAFNNTKDKPFLSERCAGSLTENDEDAMSVALGSPQGMMKMPKSLDAMEAIDAGDICATVMSLQQDFAKEADHLLEPVFYDVTSDESGRPLLVPVGGSLNSAMRIDDLPPETVVSIRVFRFTENRDDEKNKWEQELQNVNSGCLLWLPVHMKPGMHSVSGAKYGNWFTIHYVQVIAKHFNASYLMARDGCSYPAKTFGSTVPANKGTVKGQPLERGYFWFVTPASDCNTSEQEHFNTWGWKHVAREGPLDGQTFLKEWQNHGSPMAHRDLQIVLDKVRCLEKCS